MVLQLWKKKGINVNLSINEEFFREIDFRFLSFIKSPKNDNMLFKCELMISKSVLDIGIFRNFVKLHRYH